MKKTLNTLDVSDITNFNEIFKGISIIKNIKPKRTLVLEEVKDADAYLASASIRIDKQFLNKASKLKVIGSPSTGVDHMDLDLIKEKKIKCFDISKEFKLINSFTATSELAFSLILALNRKIIPAIEDSKKGVWSREKFQGFQLHGKTLGIIGLGRLGKISARIGLGFGMKVIANDIKKINYKNIKMLSLEKIAKKSDIVSIHVHLNNLTKNLINQNFFNNMKKTSFIINTARGKIINEEDLIYSLKNKIIAGAGLDVIDGEWLSEKKRSNHKLIQYARNNNNLLITPHVGGSTKESIQNARIFMAKKVAKFLSSL
ncbi:2-hydroxyacid dehydrogenase [Alphaproteobacteria bacterium]|nr:2-hydroxyacid dehydrogenase [Alphaproteobacteria bacterium]